VARIRVAVNMRSPSASRIEAENGPSEVRQVR
jgi:hypothetical protein